MVKGTVDQSKPWQIVIYQSAICPIASLSSACYSAGLQTTRNELFKSYENVFKVKNDTRNYPNISLI